MTRTILYFAWLRERVGASSEEITSEATTPRALLEELRARSAGHAEALGDEALLMVALDQELVTLDTPLGEAREVAFFPPMTGG